MYSYMLALGKRSLNWRWSWDLVQSWTIDQSANQVSCHTPPAIQLSAMHTVEPSRIHSLWHRRGLSSQNSHLNAFQWSRLRLQSRAIGGFRASQGARGSTGGGRTNQTSGAESSLGSGGSASCRCLVCWSAQCSSRDKSSTKLLSGCLPLKRWTICQWILCKAMLDHLCSINVSATIDLNARHV
jgi:hypothetical protein